MQIVHINTLSQENKDCFFNYVRWVVVDEYESDPNISCLGGFKTRKLAEEYVTEFSKEEMIT